MGPVNGRNLKRVEYFSIQEFLKNIELDSNTLEQAEYLNKRFDDYISKLMKFSDNAIILFLAKSFRKEMKFSSKIENEKPFIPDYQNESDMFFDKLSINHTRIKDLHNYCLQKNCPYDYRTIEMPVGSYRKINDDNEHLRNKFNVVKREDGEYLEDIYWYGAEASDIKKFMDDFITFYKDNSISFINSNPFIKSSLVHLLFVRIHPFNDGNGRTARMLHNIKFTDSINRIKGSKLKISPLNISPEIAKFKLDYNEYIDNIYFDLDHLRGRNNNSEEINRYLRFMIRCYEGELDFLETELEKNREALENISRMTPDDGKELYDEVIKTMKLGALQPKHY